MEMISLKNISKSFKNNIVLENIDLKVHEGESVGIIGHNGSGKSVLFKIICGMYQPDEGEVYVNQKKLGDEMDFPDQMGVFIDGPGFVEFYSGYRNLKFLADIQNKIGKEEICQAMQMVGLDSANKTKVKNYSLGMKQKLGIAQSFMENPDILLLDEPFNALDSKSHEDMIKLLLQLKAEGKTILLTSHNQEDIDTVCDKKYCFDNHKLISVNL